MLAEHFPKLLDTICESKHISTYDLASVIEAIIHGHLCDVQIASLLTAMNIKGIDSQDLTTAAKVLLKHAKPFVVNDQKILMDCVGTGGDKLNTYNISTLSSLVLASLGLPMAKHGNRKVSSTCGSSDLLSMLGVNIQLPPKQARHSLEKYNFCFLAAPLYHQGMKHAAKARQALACKTIFNLLGPLINPAHPSHSLIGVANKAMLKPMAKAVKNLGFKNALVVHGSGLDELCVHDVSEGYLIKDGCMTEFVIRPSDVGFKAVALDDLISTSPEQNKQASIDLLQGKGIQALKYAVALNAGSLLFLSDRVKTIKLGFELVLEHLNTDKSYQHLQKIIQGQDYVS